MFMMVFNNVSRLTLNRNNYLNTTMNTNGKRGALLVFEGLDRSGKSTQSRLLVNSLKESGKEAHLMVFPDRTTPVGKIISEYLSNKSYECHDKALHLLFTANRFEKMNVIKRLLYSGVNVVVDRYSFSGIAFSSAKRVLGIDSEWCAYPESGLPAPDATFLLTLSMEEMQKRPGFGDERYENIAFQTKVLEEYKKLADKYSFINIDAYDSVENIKKSVLKYSLKTIETVENTELKYLNFINAHEKHYEKKNIELKNVIEINNLIK